LRYELNILWLFMGKKFLWTGFGGARRGVTSAHNAPEIPDIEQFSSRSSGGSGFVLLFKSISSLGHSPERIKIISDGVSRGQVRREPFVIAAAEIIKNAK
jgi:hypothetical protein